MVILKNLCDSPRDYPLKNGDSIYLGSRGYPESITKIDAGLVSPALELAKHKGLLLIEKIEEIEEISETKNTNTKEAN